MTVLSLAVKLIGMALVGMGTGLGLALLAWRARYLALVNASNQACPRCGSSLKRVHRTHQERVMCAVLKVHLGRYRCSNRHCAWQGLRRIRPLKRVEPAGAHEAAPPVPLAAGCMADIQTGCQDSAPQVTLKAETTVESMGAPEQVRHS